MTKSYDSPPDRYHNREWSWLRFNERVLEEAEDASNPLLERAKFLAIFASNLDEFFKVRVAGLYRQLEAGIDASGTDKRSPKEQLDGIAEIVHELLPRQEAALVRLREELADKGVRLLRPEQLDGDGVQFLNRYYEEVVYPVVTPMIVGPTHPFPMLQDCTLYLALRLIQEGKKKRSAERIAFVGLPKVLPRFVALPGSGEQRDLVPLEFLMAARVPELFAGFRVQSINAARVTRDADMLIDEEAAEDFRKAMAKIILGRRHGAAVRLEYGAEMDDKVLQRLQEKLEVAANQHYVHKSLMQACDLIQLAGQVDRPDLKDSPLVPLQPPGNRTRSVFHWLRQGPRLLYHPYHSFDPVAELVGQAADDPSVLAIKQTLYRTSGDSQVVQALHRAAEKGKHVTAVVELRARFDEERNIEWAKLLEQAGAHVVYGLVGYKTHSKTLLVVRREQTGIRRYTHFGTGNYNDATARLYTDIGLMTCDDDYGQDASAVFNTITGATRPPDFAKVSMSPTGLRRRLLTLISREVDKSAKRSRGRIIAKMNSLVDRKVIEALYKASAAGVRVQLIVRGTCCLRAGVPGLSENIQVRSIVGRFLEHARIFWFRNGGQEELYISSADWMPRNLDHRVELMVPLEEEAHRRFIMGALKLQLSDNVKARELQADGLYTRVEGGGKERVDSQAAIYELARSQLQAEEAGKEPEGFVPLAAPRS
jgi:polyphosphate kinase